MKPTLHSAFWVLALLLPWHVRAADSEAPDMHFRPFAIEPADRTDWSHGHLVLGIDRELTPQKGTRQRTAMPLEATIGLPLGFSMVLGLEGGARTVFDDGVSSSAASRETLLKYALPDFDGVHFSVQAGISRHTGNEQHIHSRGYSFTFDTPLGDLGFGQTWDRKQSSESHGGRETGVNLFRLGLGPDGKWGMGGELRVVHTAANERLYHWLLGVARVVGHGLLADVAVGGTSSPDADQPKARRITAGLSWFF